MVKHSNRNIFTYLSTISIIFVEFKISVSCRECVKALETPSYLHTKALLLNIFIIDKREQYVQPHSFYRSGFFFYYQLKMKLSTPNGAGNRLNTMLVLHYLYGDLRFLLLTMFKNHVQFIYSVFIYHAPL